MIYFPLGGRLFEIKYVEHEKPFYQLKKNYVYTLTCELFRYEDEVIDTNVDTIDTEIEQLGHIETLTLIGSGSTATGISSYCPSGSVSPIYITNMGKKYSLPTVGFTSAPDGGVTALVLHPLLTNISTVMVFMVVRFWHQPYNEVVDIQLTDDYIPNSSGDDGVVRRNCGIITTGSVMRLILLVVVVDTSKHQIFGLISCNWCFECYWYVTISQAVLLQLHHICRLDTLSNIYFGDRNWI